jgi:hypothetical protein
MRSSKKALAALVRLRAAALPPWVPRPFPMIPFRIPNNSNLPKNPLDRGAWSC